MLPALDCKNNKVDTRRVPPTTTEGGVAAARKVSGAQFSGLPRSVLPVDGLVNPELSRPERSSAGQPTAELHSESDPFGQQLEGQTTLLRRNHERRECVPAVETCQQ